MSLPGMKVDTFLNHKSGFWVDHVKKLVVHKDNKLRYCLQ